MKNLLQSHVYYCRYVDQLRGLEAERTLLQEQLESQARAFRQYQVCGVKCDGWAVMDK